MSEVAVRVRELTVSYLTSSGELPAVNDVSFDLMAHSITGIVGESGSGKSTLAFAMVNAIPRAARRRSGSVEITGVGDISLLKGEDLRRVRGRRLGFIVQASQNSMNPLRRVGKQLLDMGRSHGVGRQVLPRAQGLAKQMGLDAGGVLTAYPHELSGGMRQRAALIFALVLDTSVLILDEPTTALDTISQAAVLKIIRDLHQQRELTTILVSHDLSVVAEIADHVLVMYAGRIVEEGDTASVVGSPAHPYTLGLMRSIPRLWGDLESAQPLSGSPPDLTQVPATGCVFRERCPLRMEVCDRVIPELQPAGGGTRRVACHAVVEGGWAPLAATRGAR